MSRKNLHCSILSVKCNAHHSFLGFFVPEQTLESITRFNFGATAVDEDKEAWTARTRKQERNGKENREWKKSFFFLFLGKQTINKQSGGASQWPWVLALSVQGGSVCLYEGFDFSYFLSSLMEVLLYIFSEYCSLKYETAERDMQANGRHARSCVKIFALLQFDELFVKSNCRYESGVGGRGVSVPPACDRKTSQHIYRELLCSYFVFHLFRLVIDKAWWLWVYNCLYTKLL